MPTTTTIIKIVRILFIIVAICVRAAGQIYPLGGEKFLNGQTVEVTWDSRYFSDSKYVSVYLIDGESMPVLLGNALAADSRMIWYVSSICGSSYRVLVQGTDDKKYYVKSRSVFSIVGCTGVTSKDHNTLDYGSSLFTYPTPAREFLKVRWQTSNVYKLTVSDVVGSVYLQQSVAGTRAADLDISMLAAGVYKLDLESEGGSHTYTPFIVSRN